jgi:hypothetical protein
MLKVVEDDNGKWYEVDDPDEAYDELPPGMKFWHPEYGRCIALALKEERGHTRFWFYSDESSCGLKVYGCGTGPFCFKLATPDAHETWPPLNSIDFGGNPL